MWLCNKIAFITFYFSFSDRKNRKTFPFKYKHTYFYGVKECNDDYCLRSLMQSWKKILKKLMILKLKIL